MDFKGRVDLNGMKQPDFDLTVQTREIGSASFLDECLRSANIDKNAVNTLFFSTTNIEALQHGIRYLVYKNSCKKHVIDKQSVNELQQIMKAMYLQNGLNQLGNTLEQVKRLNGFVLDYCVPKIIKELDMYETYRKDISQLPVPLDRGISSSVTGTKILELKRF